MDQLKVETVLFCVGGLVAGIIGTVAASFGATDFGMVLAAAGCGIAIAALLFGKW